MNTNVLLGGRIRALRTAKNYTQEQVAERLGISRQKYVQIEGGTHRITFDILVNIADMFGTTVGDITWVLNEDIVTEDYTGTDETEIKKIFDMLDLFYANKHIYTRMRHSLFQFPDIERAKHLGKEPEGGCPVDSSADGGRIH